MANNDRPAEIYVNQPRPGENEPTIRYDIPLGSGFRTGATITQDTARDLIAGLQHALDTIAEGRGHRGAASGQAAPLLEPPPSSHRWQDVNLVDCGRGAHADIYTDGNHVVTVYNNGAVTRDGITLD